MRRASNVTAVLLGAVVCVALSSCSGGGHSSCSASSDCMSGDVCVNEVCVPPGADAGPSDAGLGSGADAGVTDAGAADAGVTDAGATDAGQPDAAISDAGPVDAGPVPGAPTNVSAVAGLNNALVSWTKPAPNGGASISGYTITGDPGGTGMSIGAATHGYVSGLTAGTSYTFTVTATNAAGTGPASSPPSAAVTPYACDPTGVMFSSECPDGEICTLTQLCESPSYSASNGAVTDGVTGLVWQQNASTATYGWDSTGQSTSSAQYYCANLSLGAYSTGWRLPTLAELFTIVVPGTLPPIDQTEFPGTAESYYWTSTPDTSSYIWTIWFGQSSTYLMSGSQADWLDTSVANVRCVHDG